MNTKQHNLNPVERTFCASGLFGLPGQQRLDRDYLDPSSRLVTGTTAGMLGTYGLSAVIPSIVISA
ncbi:MAG: hypothetical protein AAGB26_17225 [Planctomycetota bacterium]